MYKNFSWLILILFLAITVSCKLFESKEKEVLGCTDEAAQNYDPDATKDDGSCDYCTGELGESFLLLIYDGGQTWEKKCFDIPVGEITDISIADSNNIWIVTKTSTLVDKAQILHSANGGYTWVEQYEDTNNNDFFNYIEMFDSNNGIAMGDGKDNFPLFLKTTDGGQTWIKTANSQLGFSSDTWRKIDFVDINTGYYKGAIPSTWGNLYKTTDSGYTWSVVNFPDSTHVGVLKFYNSNVGLTSGFYNDIQRTQDGGNTWDTVNPNWDGQSWAFDIGFHPTNPNKVWLSAGDGNLYYSDDFCTTIEKQELSSQAIKIWNIYIGESTVWGAGYWTGRELYVNRDINQSIWELIPLPLDDNKRLEGIIDGVGDNIIVLPGYYQ